MVTNLGTLSLPKSEWPKLAAILEARLAGQIALYEEDAPELSKLAAKKLEHSHFVKKQDRDRKARQETQELVEVDLNSINTSESRSLGPELLAHATWERLKFDTILESCGLSIEQIALAKATIIGRLIAPGTEMAMDTLKEKRFTDDLGRLQTSINKGHILLPSKVSVRIGRLKERYPSIAKYYSIAIGLNDSSTKVTGIDWVKKPTRDQLSTHQRITVIVTDANRRIIAGYHVCQRAFIRRFISFYM